MSWQRQSQALLYQSLGKLNPKVHKLIFKMNTMQYFMIVVLLFVLVESHPVFKTNEDGIKTVIDNPTNGTRDHYQVHHSHWCSSGKCNNHETKSVKNNFSSFMEGINKHIQDTIEKMKKHNKAGAIVPH